LVGITSTSLSNSQNINFAHPPDDLQDIEKKSADLGDDEADEELAQFYRHALSALAAIESGDYETALSECGDALKLKAPSHMRAAVYGLAAGIQEKRGQAEKSKALLEKGETICNGDSRCKLIAEQLGYAYVQSDCSSQTARDFFGRVLHQYPRDWQLWHALGVCALLNNQFDAAEKALKFADALEPSRYEVMAGLLTVYSRAGRCADAKREMARISDLFPEKVALLSGSSLNNCPSN
jgi:tetratricopeptide (TPR) repeat protein